MRAYVGAFAASGWFPVFAILRLAYHRQVPNYLDSPKSGNSALRWVRRPCLSQAIVSSHAYDVAMARHDADMIE